MEIDEGDIVLSPGELDPDDRRARGSLQSAPSRTELDGIRDLLFLSFSIPAILPSILRKHLCDRSEILCRSAPLKTENRISLRIHERVGKRVKLRDKFAARAVKRICQRREMTEQFPDGTE